MILLVEPWFIVFFIESYIWLIKYEWYIWNIFIVLNSSNYLPVRTNEGTWLQLKLPKSSSIDNPFEKQPRPLLRPLRPFAIATAFCSRRCRFAWSRLKNCFFFGMKFPWPYFCRRRDEEIRCSCNLFFFSFKLRLLK